jgi:TetR/AcrR family transcriptional regulator
MNSEKPKKTSKIRARNEELILTAAESIFATRGFGAATTAEIAKEAGIPKANLHYYFPTKEDLYLKVLENILQSWLTAAQDFDADHDPKEALTSYISTKVDLSKSRPAASKIFAKEIISGAPFLTDHLKHEINPWIEEKSKIIKQWIADGKMSDVDPKHLLFLIWSMTQTYADFSTQMQIVLNKPKLDNSDFDTAKEMICSMVLKYCNIK